MCDDGWREAMVGTLAFYDVEGERQHTIYLAATPEYGRAKIPLATRRLEPVRRIEPRTSATRRGW